MSPAMSSIDSQPVVEDIVSAFETTQNQSWSLFDNKLGSIPIKDCKKKDIFKSANPIELSDEDIPVFGLVPRLEKCVLVSCKKCLMVVRRDCLHHHYNRRHSSSENQFSLEGFILPPMRGNKHKKQKLNIRKLPEKKITEIENVAIVKQEIKTEFNIVEYERLSEINQAIVKQENEIQYGDDSDVNSALKNCNCSTSCDGIDWNNKPCTQSLVHGADHKIHDTIVKCDKDRNESPPVVSPVDEEVQSNKDLDLNDENIVNHIGIHNELLKSKTIDSNKKLKRKRVVGLFNMATDDDYSDEETDAPNKKHKKLPLGLHNSDQQSKCTTHNTYSDIIGNSDEVPTFDQSPNVADSVLVPTSTYSEVMTDKDESDEVNDNSQTMYQISPVLLNYKQPTTFSPSFFNIKNDSIYYQSSTGLPNIKDKFIGIPNSNYVNVRDEEENNENKNHKLYELILKCPNNGTQTKCSPSNKFADVKKHSDNVITSNVNSWILPISFDEDSNLEQSNKFMDVMNFKSPGDNSTSSVHSPTLSLNSKEESNSSTSSELYNSISGYYQLHSGYHESKTLLELSPNYKYLEFATDEDNLKDSYNSLPSELKNNNEMTKLTIKKENSDVMNCESSDDLLNSCDQLLAVSGIKEKSEPLIDHSDDMSDIGSIDIYYENKYNKISPELINNEEQTFIPRYKYPSTIYSSDDSEMSNDQSTQDSDKETKCTQTDDFLNHYPSTRVKKSHTHDETKFIQTDLTLECEDCYKTTDELIDSCIPANFNVEIAEDFINSYTPESSSDHAYKYCMNSSSTVNSGALNADFSVKSFSPVSSSAQVIKSTCISSSESSGSDDCDNSTSSNLVCCQHFPWSSECQISNCSTHDPSIKSNYWLKNDKINSSEPYLGNHKRNEYILNANGPASIDIENSNGKTKNLNEGVNIYGRICNKMLNSIDIIETNVKNNKKRSRQVADDKENYNLWVSANFKKCKRANFVRRKIICTDESDSNDDDNVDE